MVFKKSKFFGKPIQVNSAGSYYSVSQEDYALEYSRFALKDRLVTLCYL